MKGISDSFGWTCECGKNHRVDVDVIPAEAMDHTRHLDMRCLGCRRVKRWTRPGTAKLTPRSVTSDAEFVMPAL